ncbi:MAG: hypothetical protein JWN62_4372 [Acidimicrobiales bacterium]|nr:hypothetical protein [Acidimicrobiales bacterium]
MGLFDNTSLLKRIMLAVEPVLEPGEQAEVVVYARAHTDALASVVFGTLALAATPTYVLALTGRRLILFQGNNVNASKSMMLGSLDRQFVRVERGNADATPDRIGLSFAGQPTVTFEVPKLWRRDAARLVEQLGT